MKTYTKITAITLLSIIVFAFAGSTLAADAVSIKPNVSPRADYVSEAPTAISTPADPFVIETVVARPSVSIPIVTKKHFTDSFWSQHNGAILVIPNADMNDEDIYAITEDMNIMARIFDKKLGQRNLSSRRYLGGGEYFVEIFSKDTDHMTEAIYLQGYGALFLCDVSFPLSPPPEGLKEEQQQVEDELWTETKRDLNKPYEDRFAELEKFRQMHTQSAKYNSEKVADIKRTLIQTFKHAANIRSLQPNEWVSVVVRGPVSTTLQPKALNERKAALPSLSTTTSMTLRAKKSDIDSFQNDKLNYEQFSQHVRIITY
jgi:hypothetical protein